MECLPLSGCQTNDEDVSYHWCMQSKKMEQTFVLMHLAYTIGLLLQHQVIIPETHTMLLVLAQVQPAMQLTLDQLLLLLQPRAADFAYPLKLDGAHWHSRDK